VVHCLRQQWLGDIKVGSVEWEGRLCVVTAETYWSFAPAVVALLAVLKPKDKAALARWGVLGGIVRVI
jgi:hypothetical protein